MRRFYPILFGAAAVILIACAEKSDSTAPARRMPVKLQNYTCAQGTGMVIRTGYDGQPDTTCEPMTLRQR